MLSMRLLILTQAVDQNDADLGFFHHWIEEIAEQVDEVLVICLRKGDYHLPSNVTVLSLGKEHGAGKSSYLRRLFRYIFLERYDHVFVHMNPEYIVLCGWWWRLRKKKVLLWYTHKAINLKLRIAEKFATKIFTASKESFRLPSKKVEVVGHGIDVEYFQSAADRPSESNRLKILSVGRISPVKDYETIIRGLSKVNIGRMTKQYDIVGEAITPQDAEYKELLDKLNALLNATRDGGGIQKVLLSYSSAKYTDMPAIYKSHDLLVHSSKTGSLDKVVLEAMAAGLPVFTSSEAYVEFGDLVVHFVANDSQNLAQCIEKNINSDILDRTAERRNFIREHHNLDSLIGRIIAYFKD